MDTTTPQRMDWARVGALIAGQGVSLVGDSMLLIAMSWTAVQMGGSGAVTFLILCATIPKALMLVFGGAVADLLGPRFVLLRTASGRAILLAAGAVGVYFAENIATLAVILVVEGVLLGLGAPSFGSILPKLAPGPNLVRANSLYATVTRLAPIAGAPIGAWLIASGELWPALAVVTVTCLASLTALVFVTRDLPRPAESVSLRQVTVSKALLHRSADGLRLLRANTRLRWLFISAFTIDLAFNWPIAAALPLLADERTWGVSAVATVIAAFSAGALTATAVGALIAHRLPLVFRLVASAGMIGAGLLLMAVMPSVVSLAAVAFVVGLASGLNGPAIVSLYQDAAPADRMGAAMATLAIAGIGTAPFSIALFGSLSALIGVQATWIVCGAIALSAPLSAVAALRTPKPEPARELATV